MPKSSATEAGNLHTHRVLRQLYRRTVLKANREPSRSESSLLPPGFAAYHEPTNRQVHDRTDHRGDLSTMRIRVEYQDGSADFEGSEANLVAQWIGPPDAPGDFEARIRLALEEPLKFPPLRLVVVPGDRVVIPFDRSLPQASTVLGEVSSILREVGAESITAIIDGRVPSSGGFESIEGVEYVVHDPSDRNTLSYLANTADGRRIYLNRLVGDADCVIPIGRIGFDETTLYRGPWTSIEPALGDTEHAPASLLSAIKPPGALWDEAAEVTWLLGSQFHIGGVPGRTGVLHFLAGEAKDVLETGARLADESWRMTIEDRADVVIAGIGGPGRPASPNDFLDGLRTALRSVRRGGRVAILSRLGLDAVREAVKDPGLPRHDFEKALAWADIYLLSAADGDDVDQLGFIPLDKPEQAAKLAGSAPSFLTISQADRTRCAVDETDRV